MKIGIVYYGVLINDWEAHLIKHVERTVQSGLYEASDVFYISVVDFSNKMDRLTLIMQKYPKLTLDYHTEIVPGSSDRSLLNVGEYWGVKMIDTLGKNNDDMALLYFHSKGVVNKWKNFKTKEFSERRTKCVADWVECMVYFLIDRWEECVEKLETNDTVGVTNVNRWWWGNFWWTKSSHIKKNTEFPARDRWYSEAWLHEGRTDGAPAIKFYEWWHWQFDPFFTDHPRFLYDGTYSSADKKIVIHKAEYGYQSHQRDEGYDYVDECLTDVTDIVRNKLNDSGGKLFWDVDENILGIPEIPTNGKRAIKGLFITYFFEDRPEILRYSNLASTVILPIPTPVST